MVDGSFHSDCRLVFRVPPTTYELGQNRAATALSEHYSGFLSPGTHLHAFCRLLIFFFKINFFEKNIPGISPECQTVWIQVRPDILSGLIWAATVCNGNQQTTLVG